MERLFYGRRSCDLLRVNQGVEVLSSRAALAGCSKKLSSKAAASEEARRYVPHFVWAVRPCNASWRTEKPLQRFRPPRRSLLNVEPLSDARTLLADVFSILLVSGPCLNDDLPSLRIQADVIAFFQSGGQAGHIRNRR